MKKKLEKRTKTVLQKKHEDKIERNRIRAETEKRVAAKALGSTKMIERLPLKHHTFVKKYIMCWSPALAARESGLCSDKTSNLIGNSLLKDPDIQAAIKQEVEIQAARLNISKGKITDMLLDTYERAKERNNFRVELDVSMSLAKLHGMLVSQQHVVISKLSNMDEDQILELLGSAYNPKMLDHVAKTLPDATSTEEEE